MKTRNKTSYAGNFMVHPSQVIEIYGNNEKGQNLSIYLTDSAVKHLTEIIILANEHNQPLGHVGWHLEEKVSFPCESCDK